MALFSKALAGKALGALAIAGTVSLVAAGTAYADIPFDQPINGNATYYTDSGVGACGTPIDASTQWLVAVPAAYWTTPNPNDDPLCQGVSVQVTYNGETITLPVQDQCPTCDSSHIDLSQPVFERLTGGTDQGDVPVVWEFVQS
jgi:expansin (peptidoglycan-binding protein)